MLKMTRTHPAGDDHWLPIQSVAGPTYVGVWKIAFGVLIGNLLTGIIGAIFCPAATKWYVARS